MINDIVVTTTDYGYNVMLEKIDGYIVAHCDENFNIRVASHMQKRYNAYVVEDYYDIVPLECYDAVRKVKNNKSIITNMLSKGILEIH